MKPLNRIQSIQSVKYLWQPLSQESLLLGFRCIVVLSRFHSIVSIYDFQLPCRISLAPASAASPILDHVRASSSLLLSISTLVPPRRSAGRDSPQLVNTEHPYQPPPPSNPTLQKSRPPPTTPKGRCPAGRLYCQNSFCFSGSPGDVIGGRWFDNGSHCYILMMTR